MARSCSRKGWPEKWEHNDMAVDMASCLLISVFSGSLLLVASSGSSRKGLFESNPHPLILILWMCEALNPPLYSFGSYSNSMLHTMLSLCVQTLLTLDKFSNVFIQAAFDFTTMSTHSNVLVSDQTHNFSLQYSLNSQNRLNIWNTYKLNIKWKCSLGNDKQPQCTLFFRLLLNMYGIDNFHINMLQREVITPIDDLEEEKSIHISLFF